MYANELKRVVIFESLLNEYSDSSRTQSDTMSVFGTVHENAMGECPSFTFGFPGVLLNVETGSEFDSEP